MDFIPDMKKPFDRCACVEGITRSKLLNCIILHLVHVYLGLSCKLRSFFIPMLLSETYVRS